MDRFDLLVVGDANPDIVLLGGEVQPAFGQAERLVDEIRLTMGGSGAILACGAARLGLRVAIAGLVGDDLSGRFTREGLQERGVDTTALMIDDGAPTAATVVLSKPDDRAMLTATGPIGRLTAAMIDRDVLAAAKHIHVSSYFLQEALTPSLPSLFRQAHDAGSTTSVDPNWDPSGVWDGGLPALLEHVDVFLPNAMEALSLSRISDLDLAVARLGERARFVVVKLGEQGAIAGHAGGVTRSAGLPAAVVDTTGAGDSFDAGFLAGFIGGEPLERNLALGNACGALSTLASGGTTSQPTMEEAIAAIERGAAA
jgi:sugar/nucleoside kinase (ribokinase family)